RLDTKDLNDLRSHLNFKDWQHIRGGLGSLWIQDLQYTSVCSDHLRDCYESALQYLKRDVNINGGIRNKVEVRIMATPEVISKLSEDALGRMLKVQGVKRWPFFAGITLKQNDPLSATSSKTDIFGVLNGVESLSLDFGRLWMGTNDISQGVIMNTSIGINDLLRDLTLDDLEVIQLYRPMALVIGKTPEKDDEDCLIRIIRNHPSISVLGIGCQMERYTAVINLVISTIERMRRSGSRPALSCLRLNDPTLFDSARKGIRQDQGQPELIAQALLQSGNSVHVMFDSEFSTQRIRADLKCPQFKSEDPAVRGFIRQFGWSIYTLIVPEFFSDHLAKLLDESTEQYSSRIEHLDINPTSLTTTGLDAMNRIIKRSKGLIYLRLSLRNLHQEHQLDKALLLLERHKDQVTSLHMSLWCEESCLTKIKRTLPDRSRFPRLEEFSVDCINWNNSLRDIAKQWITSVISARTQHQASLKIIGVKIHLLPQDWEAVIKAIDLSALEELHFDNCNFSQVQLKLLADRIADTKTSSLPLKVLDLKGSKVDKMDDTACTSAILARIQQKAPQVGINCNLDRFIE
ncbi:hypothetical protein BGX34_005935, partial [Mortierella sp. NVP85]